jgi:hypothetical protein
MFNKETTMTTAATILEQLGGHRFIAMTGSKNFVGGDLSLQFSLPRNAKDGINKVRIILGADDLYRAEFWKIRGADMKCVSTSEMIYADQLANVFSLNTGLITSL